MRSREGGIRKSLGACHKPRVKKLSFLRPCIITSWVEVYCGDVFFIECASAKLLNVFQKKEPLTSAVSKSHICEFRSATAGAINGSWSL